MKPASTTSSTPACRSRSASAPSNWRARGVAAVVEDERRHARPLGAGQAPAPGDVAPTSTMRAGPRSPAGAGVDQRLQVAAPSRDQDADLHPRSSTGAPGAAARATCPIRYTVSPSRSSTAVASAAARAPRRRSSRSQVERPPHLRVGMSPSRAIKRNSAGEGQAPVSICSRRGAFAGNMRRGVLDQPAARDVGGALEQPGRVQLAQGPHVDAGRPQQGLAQRLGQALRASPPDPGRRARAAPCAPASSRWSENPRRPAPAARRPRRCCWPSARRSRSTTPTQKPARSYSPGW